MPLKTIEMHFPFKGLDESRAFVAQGGWRGEGEYSTVSCQNVVGHDPSTGRNRGGSRSAIQKWSTAQINGTLPIQEISQVIGTVEPGVLLQEDGTELLQEDGSSFFDLEVSMATDVGERLTTVVGVSGGTIKTLTSTAATSLTDGASALSAAAITIFSTQFGEDLYFADGTNYKLLDISANAVTAWTASAGTLPVDSNSNTPTLIERWHGRLVLSGVTGDPRNWYMSAVDNASDFDYSPATISATMAVAGNNSDAGMLGDIVTALIPYTDDVLYFGGDHTIYRMSGDPADGGRLDLVSDITGVAWGRAWCKSPEGTVYFVGSRGGLYRIDPNGGVPQRLTATTIDERLADLNMQTNIFRLAWDDRAICVRVFITPKDGSATTHYTWDVRNEAWWPVVFENSLHNPMSTCLLSGDSENNRVLLMAGQDGYVRYFNPDAANDDGEAIDSFVLLGPLDNITIMEFQATLGKESGNLQWSIHSASEAESAIDAGAKASGQWVGGRNRSQWPRSYINAGYVKLSSTSPWSLERVLASVSKESGQRSRLY